MVSMERPDIPAVPLTTSAFEMAAPSIEETKMVVRKARNRSASGANGFPHLVHKSNENPPHIHWKDLMVGNKNCNCRM